MRLIARHDRTLRRIARSYRLGPADVDDDVQVTWTRLYQHTDRLRDPNAVAGWLARTTRREARPEAVVLAAEEREIPGRAVATCPGANASS